MLANARRLARLIERESVDLVHARSRAPAWSALLAARRTGRPFVTTYHGAYGETEPRQAALQQRHGARRPRHRQLALHRRPDQGRATALGDARIRVIHRGVDVARFDPAAVGAERVAALRRDWGIGADDRVILQAARLTGWKGQSVLIEAAGAAAATGAARTTPSSCWPATRRAATATRRRCERQIADAGLGDRVRLVGHCDDMPAAYALAHVAVVASTEPEAFGRAAAEAQAMGCPVIATAIGAPPETVLAAPRGSGRASRAGWFRRAMPRPWPSAIAAGAGARPARPRSQLGARARAACRRTTFRCAAMQQATLAVYDELLGTGPGAPAFPVPRHNRLATGTPDKA